MKQTKDLSWLSAPAFFLIIGMIVFNMKSRPVSERQIDKTKTVVSVPVKTS